MGNAKKFHPLTGAPIVPLGYRKDGRPIMPILGGDDTVPPADPPPADTPPNDPPPADPPAPKPDDLKQPPWGKPENFDAEKAWELIQNLRTEKGDPARVAELEGKLTEFQTAQQQQMDALAKALGFKQDDAPADPAALAAQIETEKATAADAQRQLAVFQNAGEADPRRLLDSASFLRSIKDIDPADTVKITAAVTAAVEADPLLKAAQPPATPPFPGGPRTPAPTQAGSLGEAINARLASKNR